MAGGEDPVRIASNAGLAAARHRAELTGLEHASGAGKAKRGSGGKGRRRLARGGWSRRLRLDQKDRRTLTGAKPLHFPIVIGKTARIRYCLGLAAEDLGTYLDQVVPLSRPY